MNGLAGALQFLAMWAAMTALSGVVCLGMYAIVTWAIRKAYGEGPDDD